MWEVPELYRPSKGKVDKPSDRFDKRKKGPKNLIVAPKKHIKPIPTGYLGTDVFIAPNPKQGDSMAFSANGDDFDVRSLLAMSIDSFDQAFVKSPSDTYRKKHPKKGIIPSPLRRGSPGSRSPSPTASAPDGKSLDGLQPGISSICYVCIILTHM